MTKRTALVTGGTRGIGAATSRLLAQAGADVCVGYRSRHNEAAAMRDELAALGVKHASLAADIGSELSHPEDPVSSWCRRTHTTVVPMPKAAIDEDHPVL